MLENLTVKTKAISSQAYQIGRKVQRLSPEGEYSQAAGSALGPERDHDIVSSAWKHAAVRKDGLSTANLGEDLGTLTVTASDAIDMLFEFIDHVASIPKEWIEDFKLAA